MVVVEAETFEVIERVGLAAPAKFPYVPGLLSFREAPALLEAFDRLKTRPDVVLCDGQGIAHPRRLGIASHLGLWLDLPTVGCAKSRLCGKYDEPGPDRGDRSPLVDKGEVIGAVLRTRAEVAPLFVSPGHRCDLEGAVGPGPGDDPEAPPADPREDGPRVCQRGPTGGHDVEAGDRSPDPRRPSIGVASSATSVRTSAAGEGRGRVCSPEGRPSQG